MLRTTIFIWLALIAVSARAQTEDRATDAVRCSDFGNSPGCTSFNDMVRAGDGDVLAMIPDVSKKYSNAYVCLDPLEDRFLMLSFLAPRGPDDQLWKGEKRGIKKWQYAAAFGFTAYENGQENNPAPTLNLVPGGLEWFLHADGQYGVV